MNVESLNESRMNSSETPNPMRDETPSQLTVAKSPSPEDIKVVTEPKKIKFPMSNTDMLESLSKFL
jgi:hypothetical protein